MNQTIAIRMGGYQGAESVHTRAARLLAERLAASGAPARLDLLENVTALGRPAADLFTMVEGEELDLCYFASSYLVHRVPELAVFDLPFAVTSRDTLYARLDGAPGDEIARRVAARTGYRLLAFWDNGFRHFSNWQRPIRAPADCAGLKIRTMSNTLHQKTFAALGFDPVFMDVKDFPEAVRTHAVDAQENPLTNTLNFGVSRTHRHVTLSAHFCGVTLVLANAARHAAWPEAVRRALASTLPAVTRAQRRFAAEEDDTCLAALRADGVAVVDAAAFDRAGFVAATRAVRDACARDIDPDLLRLFA